MPAKTDIDNKLLNAWLLLHQCYKLVSRLEDITFAEIGITAQQHAVLAAIKTLYGPITPSQLAHWLYQNPNGVSMLINRMEKDGLVKRLRGFSDRREVQLALTKKGEKILERSTVAGWQLVTQVMGEFRLTELEDFIRLFERLREGAFARLNPGESMKKIKTRKEANIDRVVSRLKGAGDTGDYS